MRLAVLALVASLLLAPSLARAVECGDVLVADTVLDHDLECEGDGLIIGAHRIIVDLNGHAIAKQRYSPLSETAGIRVAGFDDVQITSGTVRGFENSVLIRQAKRTLLSNVRIDSGNGPRVGVAIFESARTRIRQNQFETSADAILVVASTKTSIIANKLDSGDWGTCIELRSSNKSVIEANWLHADENDILLIDSHHNMIRRNFLWTSQAPQMQLVGSNDNQIVDNSSTGGFTDGLVLRQSHDNRVVGNDLTSDVTGALLISSNRNVIESNWVAADAGIVILSGSDNRVRSNRIGGGIVILSGSDNRVRDNHISADPEGRGILLTDADGSRIYSNAIKGVHWGQPPKYAAIEVQGSSRVVLERNRVSGGSDGILVDASSDRVRLVENSVRLSRGDGIDASGQGVLLRGNMAISNRDYGIVAAPGVIDGGGNHALDNGNPDQCLNLACE